MKPKLVIATDNFLPRHDGVARFLQEIIPRMVEYFQVTIICPRREGIAPLKQVHVITVPLSKLSTGDFTFPQFKPQIIRKALKGADLVFTQTIGPIGGLAMFFAWKKRITACAYIHSLEWELAFKSPTSPFIKKYFPFIVRRIARFLYARVQRVFVPSEIISEKLTWEKIYTPRSIVSLGVNSSQFTPATDRESIRTQLGYTSKDIVLGYHGRIAREKDVSTLLRSYVKLRKHFKNLHLLLIGDGITSLRKQFAKQPGVQVYAGVNDVEKYLPAMDIYCLPSLTETTSLSVLEAMSCGLAVVSTPVGFVQDYIKNGVTGFLTPKKDSYTMALQLRKLIIDPELRARMGSNARSMVQEHFNWDVTAQKLTSELTRL